jgi:hypothetical protein
MSTKTIEKKLNNLNREIVMLRSALVAAISQKDPEGEYRPEFVRKILGLVKKRSAGILFAGPNDFLKKIN